MSMLAVRVVATVAFSIASFMLLLGGFRLSADDKTGRRIMAFLLATEILAIMLTWEH